MMEDNKVNLRFFEKADGSRILQSLEDIPGKMAEQWVDVPIIRETGAREFWIRPAVPIKSGVDGKNIDQICCWDPKVSGYIHVREVLASGK